MALILGLEHSGRSEIQHTLQNTKNTKTLSKAIQFANVDESVSPISKSFPEGIAFFIVWERQIMTLISDQMQSGRPKIQHEGIQKSLEGALNEPEAFRRKPSPPQPAPESFPLKRLGAQERAEIVQNANPSAAPAKTLNSEKVTTSQPKASRGNFYNPNATKT